MFSFPFVTVLFGVVVIAALAFARTRRAIRPEPDYYLRAQAQASSLLALDMAQFERLCLRLAEERGLRISSHGRPGPREIELTAVGTDPLTGGTYLIQGVLAKDEELVDASRVLALASAVRGEGAAKGILITTGYFSEDAARPLEGPPIELINGPRLRALRGQREAVLSGSTSRRLP